MKKRASCIFLLVLLYSIAIHAQQPLSNSNNQLADKQKGYFNISEAGLSYGRLTQEFEESVVAIPSDYHGRTTVGTFRTVNGVFINSHFSIGLGTGFERSSKNPNQHYDGLLLYIDGRYYLKNTGNTLFAYTDFGFSAPLGSSGIHGTLFNPGLGYKLMANDHYALVFSSGYNRLIRQSNGSGGQMTSTIGFRVGLLF